MFSVQWILYCRMVCGCYSEVSFLYPAELLVTPMLVFKCFPPSTGLENLANCRVSIYINIFKCIQFANFLFINAPQGTSRPALEARLWITPRCLPFDQRPRLGCCLNKRERRAIARCRQQTTSICHTAFAKRCSMARWVTLMCTITLEVCCARQRRLYSTTSRVYCILVRSSMQWYTHCKWTTALKAAAWLDRSNTALQID